MVDFNFRVIDLQKWHIFRQFRVGGKTIFYLVEFSKNIIWELSREIMSESNLAYNNDGSMNTSADYLGKFLQYIYNDFAVENGQ